MTRLVTAAIPHPRATRPRHITPARAWRARHFVALKGSGAADWMRRGGWSGLETIYRRWSPTWDLPPAELEATKACFEAPGSLDAALGYYRAVPLLGPHPKLLERTTVPSLCLYGADDGVADAALFESAREAYTGPHQLVPIARAGHFLQREQPGVFAEAVLGFVAS